MKKGVLILSISICNFAFSQVQFNSLDDMLKYADENAVAVKTSLLQNDIQKTKEKETKSYWYPTITANAGVVDNITLQSTLVPSQAFNPTAPAGSYTEVVFGKEYQYSTSLNANWDVLNFQKMLNSKIAQLEIEAGKLAVNQAKYNVYNQLSSTYYSILLGEESLKIFNENKSVSSQLLEIANNQYEKGIISEIELNRAKINDLDILKNIEYTQNNISQWYLQLQSQLNTQEKIMITDEFATTTPSVLELVGKHPDVQFAEAETKIYEANVKTAKALRYPNISLQYQYNTNWLTDEFFNFSDVNKIPQQFVGLKISKTIFNGFQTKHKVKESEQQLQLQNLKVENLKLTKTKEDEILLLQQEQAIQQLNNSKEILALQKNNDKHAENKYAAGIIGLNERLDKYQDLLSVQNEYLKSLADYTLIQYKMYIRQIQF